MAQTFLNYLNESKIGFVVYLKVGFKRGMKKYQLLTG